MAVTRKMLTELERLLRPLSNRVANSLARAVVRRVTDTSALQGLQIGVLRGETKDDAERFQEYGFSSVPLDGAEAVVLFPNGNRAHPLVVAVDDRRYRPTGKPGGHACIYHYTGAIIEFSEDGDIIATPATGQRVRLGSAAASDAPATRAELDAVRDATVTALNTIATGSGTALAAVSVVGAAKVRVE